MKEYENLKGIVAMLNQLKEKLNIEYPNQAELVYKTANEVVGICYALKAKGIVVESSYMVQSPSSIVELTDKE